MHKSSNSSSFGSISLLIFGLSWFTQAQPTLTCPSGVVTECSGGLTPVTYTATAVGFGGTPPPVTCMPPSGTGFRLGVSNVVCWASGLVSVSNAFTNVFISCTFEVAVVDTTPPSVSCNSNITATATGPSGAVANYVASAADSCGIHSLDCTPPAGSTFPIGTTTVICTATDIANNTGSCSFLVRVVPPNAPPVCDLQSPCAWMGGDIMYILALNGANACIALNGSGSVDPNGDPLSYSWTLDDAFTVNLDPSQEPNGGGTGSGIGTVSLSGNTLTIDVTFSGLSANATAMHIHGPAAPGVNAAVLYPLNSIGTLGGTAGTIKGTVTLAEGTGGFTIAQQLNQLRQGLWYINIHTPSHPGGEIRGQVLSGFTDSPVVTTCLNVGSHSVVLTVSDGVAQCTCQRTVYVITPCEAIENCISLIESTSVARKVQRPVIASLKAACASFARGNLISGVNQLEACQKKIDAQIARTDPVEAQTFVASIQQLLDVLECITHTQ